MNGRGETVGRYVYETSKVYRLLISRFGQLLPFIYSSESRFFLKKRDSAVLNVNKKTENCFKQAGTTEVSPN